MYRTLSWLLATLVLSTGSYFLGARGRTVSPQSHPIPIPRVSTNQLIAAASAQEESRIPSRTNTFDWHQVESPDYRQYITNLRTIGCPEQTVRDIIIADVTQLYETKASALRRQAGPYEYWRTDASGDPAQSSGHLHEAIISLDRERREVIHTLLGTNLEPLLDRIAFLDELDPRLDFLPVNRQKEVQKMERRFTELRSKAMDNGTGDEDTLEVLARLQAEREDYLNSALLPGEREEYDLRVSATADALRRQLNAIPVNSEEFRELFQYQNKFDQAFPPNDLGLAFSPARQKERAEAETQLQSELQRILGEERFRSYLARKTSTPP